MTEGHFTHLRVWKFLCDFFLHIEKNLADLPRYL